MNIAQLHRIYLTTNSICTDTRKLKENDLYFALKGENFNGNTFANQAIEQGASFVVIDEEQHKQNDRFILVNDALTTLQELANFHRRFLDLKIIALTGSNGKTTTKELINSVLSTTYKTVATKGNLNNHIGVPLTLLSMSKSTEIGIVEMGANHLKEIEFLCSIAEPNYGYITNFGKAHLEGFGSVEGVIKGKSELYNYLKENENLIFVNSEDKKQLIQIDHYKEVFTFGSSTENEVAINFIEADPFVVSEYNNIHIKSQLIGNYNFSNISSAIAMGSYFKIDTSNIKTAIESYIPENNRSQIIEKGNIKIILDAYNANPTSMKAALDNLSNLKANHKTVILGDMFELGDNAIMEHQEIADYASDLNIDNIILVGEHFYKVEEKEVVKYKTFNDLKLEYNPQDLINNTVLIKGSRGMALERILDLLD